MAWLTSGDAHWLWLALGLAFGIAEMAIPGFFLIWLGLAAIATGVITWLTPIGLPIQIMIFAALAFLAVFSGRRLLQSHPVQDADPLMNQRAARLVGETAIVTEPIEGGRGRIHVGDSEWIAKGPDTSSGTRVRISGSDGVVLLVEPIGPGASQLS